MYAEAFGGAGLQSVGVIPEAYKDVWGTVGGLHDLNPVNELTGTIR